MDKKSRNIFMAFAGGYLVYTGYSLVVDVMSREPENKTLFMIAGAVFVIIGAFTVIMNLKAYFKDFKKDVFGTEETVEELEDYIDDTDNEEIEDEETEEPESEEESEE